MKLNGSFVLVMAPASAQALVPAPTVNVTSNYSFDCTEDEHERIVNAIEKINADWLPVRQDIVKALFCTPSFKDLISAAWETATVFFKHAVKELAS